MIIQKFISFLLSTETFNFVNIIYLDTKFIEVAVETTNLPRIIFNFNPKSEDIQIAGLMADDHNLREALLQNTFNTTVVFQKLFFSSSIFSIIILNSTFTSEELSNLLILLYFQYESKILLIFEKETDFGIVDIFKRKGLVNLILISAYTFRMNQEFSAFEFSSNKMVTKRFTPEFKGNAFQNQELNLQGYMLNVTCPFEIPNCLFSEDEEDFGGIMMHILVDFQKKVNASLQFFTDSRLKIQGMSYISQFSIHAMTAFMPPFNSIVDFGFNQFGSYPLETFNLIIVAPSPSPIDQSLYPLKPFSLSIWICIFLIILYSSILIKLSTKSKITFGRHFTTILRLAFAQPVDLCHNDAFISLFVIFVIVFGFIINVWFGSILGSFMTTSLKEPPLKTFEDIRRKGLKIASPNTTLVDASFNYITDYIRNKDLFDFFPFKNVTNLLKDMDHSFAYAEVSNHWNYFIVPQMNYFDEIKFTKLEQNSGTSFIKIYFDNPYLFLKNSFNRLLLRIQEVGLYKYYTDLVFVECQRFNLINYNYVMPGPRIKPLILRYFKYIFIGWIFGIGFSLIVFIFEIFKIYKF